MEEEKEENEEEGEGEGERKEVERRRSELEHQAQKEASGNSRKAVPNARGLQRQPVHVLAANEPWTSCKGYKGNSSHNRRWHCSSLFCSVKQP